MAQNRRKDNKNRVLKDGEYQRKNGTYEYRWRDKNGKRHSVYSETLNGLRKEKDKILKDHLNGLKNARNLKVDDMFKKWMKLKKGLKDNTFQNYIYLYNQFVKPVLGNVLITNLRKTDIRSFYNFLAEERKVKINTIDSIHTVLHQVLEITVEDNFLNSNPSDNALKELRQSRPQGKKTKKALTIPEQKLFEYYIGKNGKHYSWYPIFTTLLWTGMRVGEATGLRWEDIDFDNNLIHINHTLVYYDTRTEDGCTYAINTPKTEKSNRSIPLLPKVKEALLIEKERQKEFDIPQNFEVDGYSNFVFLNRFGSVFNQGTLNKALKRIIRDCNFEVLDGKIASEVTLPNFTNHSLRHTFTTRMVESDVNIKVMQEILGHSDVSTTMNIYAEASTELKERELTKIGEYLSTSLSNIAN